MIEYKNGCLIEAFKAGEINILAHGCNCQGVMGAGVAKLVKANWPKAFQQYKRFCDIDKSGAGLIIGDIVWSLVEDDKCIANLLTQETCGSDGRCYVNYAALKLAFYTMFMCLDKDSVIGIPKIGAGLAGGNWDIIEQCIQHMWILSQFEGKLVVYDISNRGTS